MEILVQPLPPIKQSGFTLIEVVLVMSIMLITMPLIYQRASVLREHQTIKHFELELENLIYLAQITAIAEEKIVTLHFDNERRFVTVQTDLFHEIDHLSYPNDVTVKAGTHSLTIQFNYKGSIDQAGTIMVLSPHYTYKFTFLLGQGRFYVDAI